MHGCGDFWEYLITRIPKEFRRSARKCIPRRSKPKPKVSKRVQDSEPFREPVRHQHLTHLKNHLYAEEYEDYARTPVSCMFDSLEQFFRLMPDMLIAARFIKAHSLLQSRRTIQAEDIPLVLMDMSCMNVNAISQSKTIDTRMTQLFYGLESLPTELLLF